MTLPLPHRSRFRPLARTGMLAAATFVCAAVVQWASTNAVAAQDTLDTRPTSDTDDSVAAVQEMRVTLRDGMTAAEQSAAIRSILGNLEEERFYRQSVVSPFVFELQSIGKLENGGQRQRLDVWFITYGKLATIQEKQLMDDLMGPETKPSPGLPEVARALTADELRERNLNAGDQPDGSGRSYGIVGANLLDKAFVTGITSSRYRKTDESIELFLRLVPQLVDDADFPARWHSITKATDGTFELGPPHPYSDLAALIKVTQLAGVQDGLLVEAHVIYAEPYGWFEGRNLLRSKLPPVLQDLVRKFRRKLAQ